MSFKRPGKVSAFQVQREDQRKCRQTRSYRSSNYRARSSSYDSPSRSSERSLSSDRLLHDDYERHRLRGHRNQEGGSDSHFLDMASSYSEGRESLLEHNSKRSTKTMQHSSGNSDNCSRSQYPGRDKLERNHSSQCKEEGYGDVRRNDHHRTVQEENYLVVDVRQERSRQWNSDQYSDSDEELLHESLRRKKHTDSYLSDEDDKSWSPDRYSLEKNNQEKTRKRKLKGTNRHDSPGPSRSSKVWKQDMSCGSSAIRKSEEPDSEGEKHLASSQAPKKKTKSRKNFKGKEKKQKTCMSNNAQVTGLKLGQKGKIPSLMDLEFPPSISARNLEKSPADVQPNYSSTPHGDKHGRFTDAEFDDRPRSEYRSQSESGAEVQACFRVHDRDTRHLDSHTRKSGGDRRLLPSDYDIEHRCSDYVDYDGPRDNIRCGNYEADYRHYEQDDSVSSRRNKHGYLDQDAPRGNAGRLVDSRSPDFHRHSDSDQDSDRDGTRRSWREEKRSRHSKRKNEKSADDEAKVKATKNVLKKDKKHSDRMSSLKKSEKSQAGKSSADHVEDADSNSDNRKGEVETAVRHLILPMLDSLVVLLAHPHEICLRGRARLCVVTGSISIMGYQIIANRTRHYEVYSPASSSFLTVRTQSMEKDKKVLRKSLKALGIEEKQVHDFMEGAVILVARRLNAPVVDFISSLPTFSQLFKFNLDRSAGNMPPPPPHHQQMVRTGVAILPVEQVPGTTLRLTSDFDLALQKWLAMIRENAIAPVAVMCGGQNCGKSTFARHMVNAALAIVPRVCFLECDVGQTEFSPPGCVALTFVDKPVLGPPFCHQTTAESMCFVGLTSPGESPTRYIHCLQHVFRTYRKQEPALPLVVNTMGWNEGLGLKLFMDTLNLTAPDLIVQLGSSNQALNFPVMTPELVALEPGWLYNTDPIEDKKEKIKETKKHELVVIDSQVSNRDPKAKLTPRNQRDLALLAHLIKGIQPGVTLTSAVPYAVPWRKIGVYICHSPVPLKRILSALNASVVALCKADISLATKKSDDLPLFFEEAPVCDCLGYGLVRGIDMKKGVLLIVTGVPPHRVASVNTLLRGAISIPDQLFFKQANLDDVPYIDALEPGTAVSSVRPRTHMPRHTPYS